MSENSKRGIGFALGGLAGNNAHGAGFLQAALDKKVIPDMISCTSGQLLWVWHYLRLLDSDKKVSENQTLEERFNDEIDKLSPSSLIFGEYPPLLNPPKEFLKWTAELSQQWPFARDFTWWWLAFLGKNKRYKPSFESISLDALCNAQQSMRDLLEKIKNGKLGNVFLVEFLANILPNRLLKPDFEQIFFEEISNKFNQAEFGEKQIGIIFNSYDPKTGNEDVYINQVAKDRLGRQFGDSSSYRKNTKYQKITPEAVRNALWLYMYGFDNASKRLDGAYFRDVILSELCVPDMDQIFSVRPIHPSWIGSLPTTWTAGKDLETEVGFNGAYIGERDIIALMNKVGDDLKIVLDELKNSNVKLSQKIKASLSKYSQIKIIDVDMDAQRGYFDYVFEDKCTFNNAKAKGMVMLS